MLEEHAASILREQEDPEERWKEVENSIDKSVLSIRPNGITFQKTVFSLVQLP
jgi:hypothetical protein